MKAITYKSTISVLFKEREESLTLRKSLTKRAEDITFVINNSEDTDTTAQKFKELINVYLQLEILKYKYPGQSEFDSAFYIDLEQESALSFSFFINEHVMIDEQLERRVEELMKEDGWNCSIEFIMKQVDCYHVSLSLL